MDFLLAQCRSFLQSIREPLVQRKTRSRRPRGRRLGVEWLENRRLPATLSIDDVTVDEGGAAQFTVSLSQSCSTPVTLMFGTSDGTAAAPGDYTGANGSLTFMPGQTSKSVSVPTNVDLATESTETFQVNLSMALGATIADGTGVGSINDVPLPTVSLQVSDAGCGEFNQNTGAFAVYRTGSTAAALTVNYTVGGTATSGSDYTALAGSVTIAAGASSAAIVVTPVDDSNVESIETVTVTLAQSITYQLGFTYSQSVDIVDNDNPNTAPIIDSFTAVGGVDDTWTLSGHVTDEHPLGLVVTFGGVLASYGITATVQSDGTFSTTQQFVGLQDGFASAVTVDLAGLSSNLATTYMDA